MNRIKTMKPRWVGNKIAAPLSIAAGILSLALTTMGTALAAENLVGTGDDLITLTLPIAPGAVTTTCSSGAIDGQNFGSTTATTNQYVGRLYYNAMGTGSDPSLGIAFTHAKLQIACRGVGVIELVHQCSTVVATINCTSGNRPWTAASNAFVPPTPGLGGEWNLRVRATSGTLEWANPVILLW